jgi:hypothetical protein
MLQIPFGLSLSKPCIFGSLAVKTEQPFDKLRANGFLCR